MCVCARVQVNVWEERDIDSFPPTNPTPSKLSFPCTLHLAPKFPASALIRQGASTLAVPRLAVSNEAFRGKTF